MPPLDPEKLLESVATALETLAFMAAEPLEDQPAEIDTVQVILPFEGSLRGESRLTTSRTLGSLIANNVLVDGTAQQNTLDKADDALRELTNVITGLVFRQICESDDIPMLSVPAVSTEVSPSAEVNDLCSVSLAAEGHPVHFSIRVEK